MCAEVCPFHGKVKEILSNGCLYVALQYRGKWPNAKSEDVCMTFCDSVNYFPMLRCSE